MKKVMKKVKLSELKMGPVRQDILPEGFIVRVQKYKEILREVETSPLEQAINCFQRDLHPERELQIWENIASAYKLSSKNNPEWTLEEKKEAFGELLLASLG
jgi:hypothetical protein